MVRVFEGSLGTAEEGLLDAAEARRVVATVVGESDVVSVGVDAIVVSKESEDVGIENLFSPAARLNVTSGDVSIVELGNLFVVEEEGSLDGGKVDRVDQFVVDVLQETPLEAVFLRVVDDPFVQAFSAGMINLAVIEAKHGIELHRLLEHVKVGARDGNVRVDLLNVVEVVQNLLLPRAEDTEADHLKVASSPGAVRARRLDALDAGSREVALAKQRKVGELLVGEVRSHGHPVDDRCVLEPQVHLVANLASTVKGQNKQSR